MELAHRYNLLSLGRPLVLWLQPPRDSIMITCHISQLGFGVMLLSGLNVVRLIVVSCFLAGLLVFSATATLASDPSRIRIATEEYPPYTSSGLRHFGIDAHIIQKAFELEGVEVVYEFMPGARAFQATLKGHFDATVPWAMREDRKQHFHFPDPLIAVDDEFFFHRKDLKFSWNARKPDYSLLKGKNIAAINGYDYGPAFQTAEKDGVINVTRVRKLELGFKMLTAGRVDLVISKERVAMFELQKLHPNGSGKKFARTRERFSPKSFDYLIVSKKAPNAAFFVEAFNRGLAKLKASGRYERFLQDFANGAYALTN